VRFQKWVLRILDSRWLSRVRALFFLGTTGTAGLLIVVGAILAGLKALTDVGVVPLVFIGLGLLLLLARGGVWLRHRIATRRATQPEPSTEREVPWRDDPAEVADGLARVRRGVQELIAERGLDRSQVPAQLLPAFDRDTTARYYIRLRDDALGLFDRAVDLGVVTRSERAKVENPGNLNDVSLLLSTITRIPQFRSWEFPTPSG
jgi:hypothetical protein